MNLLRSIWQWISFLGVPKGHHIDKSLIVYYNRLSFICSLGAIGIILLGVLKQIDPIYVYVVSFLTFPVYAFILVFNSLKRYRLSQYLISIGSPIWINTIYILIGGYFAQSIALFASIAITYVSFRRERQQQLVLISFNVLSYIAAVIYVNEYGVLLQQSIDLPYDELMVFIGGLAWSAVVIFLFDKERVTLLNDLEANNLRLQRTTEELERFTYIASHDLKSPLRTIRSFIALIERDINKGDYDSLQEKLGFVKTGAEQMNFLVRDILELSQVNSFKDNHRVEVDLNQALQKALYNLKDEIESSDAEIQYDRLPTYHCNELEFVILFQNFIQNAIKYNDSSIPKAEVRAIRSKELLTIKFIDNGIGIKQEYHEQIFEFFKRLHNSDQYTGTGLGLGLCRQIIERYEANITIDSEPGRGSIFQIQFPIKDEGIISQELYPNEFSLN